MITPLKLARLNKNISQWKLASLIGVTQSELSYYELGRRRCAAHIRHKIADALQISVTQLFPDEEKERLNGRES